MPLIRYVTDDVARALDGPCPCGRTLPAFGEIAGRHSQMAGLPAGTMMLVTGLRQAIETLPLDLSRPLREYQVRQDESGDFEIRLVLAGSIAPGFAGYIEDRWTRALAALGHRSGTAPKLSIREVAEIPRAPSGKFFHFVSDIARPREAKDYAGPTAKDTGA
jgi:phenylacetate-coenzyme A ligase PaaK-like adenylate-forming protein